MTRVSVAPEMREIMPRYLEIRARELGLIRTACTNGDATEVRLLGHRLKGSGGSYGLHELSRLGQELERAGAAGDLGRAALLIDELAAYLDNLEITYDGDPA
ncbi:MAG: Hpt domain-containing protein [Desulfovibrionaceae bacterium]